MRLTIELEDRDAQYLLAFVHLQKAERDDENPNAPTTSPTDFIPPEVDARIYEALTKAVYHPREGH